MEEEDYITMGCGVDHLGLCFGRAPAGFCFVRLTAAVTSDAARAAASIAQPSNAKSNPFFFHGPPRRSRAGYGLRIE